MVSVLKLWPSTTQTMLNGTVAGLAHMDKEREPVELFLRAPIGDRAGVERLKEITLTGGMGDQVPLSELVKVRETIEDKTIHRKNLKRVVYVDR